MPRFEPRVAMTISAVPAKAALPAKHRPATIAILGAVRQAARSGRRSVRRDRRTRCPRCRCRWVVRRRFGEDDDGHRPLVDHVEQPVDLLVMEEALRAGHHRIVDRDHGAGDPVSRARPDRSRCRSP